MRREFNSLICRAGLLALLLLLLALAPALAQAGDVRLSTSKDWGFSLGSQIQGRFTFRVTAPAGATGATLWLDGKAIAEDAQAPFEFPLDTGAYATGQHVMSATVRTADGRELRSQDMAIEFVSGLQAGEATQRLALPILGGALLIAGLGAGASAWISARERRHMTPEQRRHYGLSGGAICPRCGRPFAIFALAPNLITGKLMRCPACGKWVIARRASVAALAQAEAAEDAGAVPAVPTMSEEERLRRQLEESRYQ